MAWQIAQDWGVSDPLSGGDPNADWNFEGPRRGGIVQSQTVRTQRGDRVMRKNAGSPGTVSKNVPEVFGGSKSYDSGERFGSRGDSFGGEGGGFGLGGMGCGADGTCTACAGKLVSPGIKGMNDDCATCQMSGMGALFDATTQAAIFGDPPIRTQRNLADPKLSQFYMFSDQARSLALSGDSAGAQRSLGYTTTAFGMLDPTSQAGVADDYTFTTNIVSNAPGAQADAVSLNAQLAAAKLVQPDSTSGAIASSLYNSATQTGVSVFDGLIKFAAALAVGYVVIKAVK